MSSPAIGLDFGTSNTAAALLVDGQARVLKIDAKGVDPRLFRSVLFFPEDAPMLSGAEAIEAYLDSSEGRLLQSLKTFLPVKSFTATSIRGRSFTLESLISLLLLAVRLSAEREVGSPIQKVTLGRPARFSEDPAIDAFGERRLLKAALAAGFTEVVFRIEPLAAGLAHEATLDHDEVVLTGDFGAGTSDFTIMRLSPSRHRDPDRRKDVLASAGVYVGGDAFDGAIMEHKLLPCFGSTSHHRPMGRPIPMPIHMMRTLLSWHTMSFIRDRSTQNFLGDFLRTTDQPQAVAALIDLVEHNLGYHVFRAIEQAKVELSRSQATRLVFREARVKLDVPITRTEFERIIEPLVDKLEACLDGVLRISGLTPTQIDAVVLTGGSSLIPCIAELFERRFGAEKLRRTDAFSSVAEGLAAAAGAR